MSIEAIGRKRKRLRNEIEIAQNKLEQNVENLSPQDYLPSISDLIPDIISSENKTSSSFGVHIPSNLASIKSVLFTIINKIIKLISS